MDHVVLDVEIQRMVSELPNGWKDTHLMGVSIAIVYDMNADRYQVYGHEHIEALQHRLLIADRITTYNGWSFDFPVIWGLPQPQRVVELTHKSDDLLARIWKALGAFEKGWTLNQVAHGTIGRGKTGTGEMAPILYKEGRWVDLVNYCMDDVRLTRDLCLSVDRDGWLSNGYKRLTPPPWKGDPS